MADRYHWHVVYRDGSRFDEDDGSFFTVDQEHLASFVLVPSPGVDALVEVIDRADLPPDARVVFFRLRQVRLRTGARETLTAYGYEVGPTLHLTWLREDGSTRYGTYPSGEEHRPYSQGPFLSAEPD